MSIETEKKSYRAVIAIAAIFFNELDNVRGDWEYDTDPNKKWKEDATGGAAGLHEDIRINGLTTPLWIRKLTESERVTIHAAEGVWYDYACIRGFRRGRVIKNLVTTDPGRFKFIPCDVFEGLSKAEELDLLIDQGNTKGLSDWGWYLAIKKLMQAGMTEARIMAKTGLTRGFVQNRTRVAKLPQFVEDAYLARCKKKPTMNLTDAHVIELSKAREEDEKNQVWDNVAKTGPTFEAKWDLVVKEKIPAPVKAKTRGEMQTMISVQKDPIVLHILKWCAGDVQDITSALTALETLRGKALSFMTGKFSDSLNVPQASNEAVSEPEASNEAPVITSEPEASNEAVSEPEASNEAVSEPEANSPSVPFEPEPETSNRASRRNKKQA